MEEKLKYFFLNPASYPHEVASVRHLETHISHIFIAGDFAYKVKKPVDFGFLDFSTLEKRHLFCEREVALNRRFAPDLYEGVIPIHDNNGSVSFAGPGQVIEYAVKMKRLDERSLFTELLEDNNLLPEQLIFITREIARFHQSIEGVPTAWGIADVRKVIENNIEVFRRSLHLLSCTKVEELDGKIKAELRRNEALIILRQKHFVKPVHGDLHLRNIALLNGRPILFDGIEFSEKLSCCDVWADLAFLTMDLAYRERPDLAALVANIYLEETDDYEGLKLRRMYESYRAAVRAKVSCLGYAEIADDNQRNAAKNSAMRHLDLALSSLMPSKRFLVGVGGLSGTGKTTLARAVSASTNAVHVRSDVIRKHLLGLNLLDRAGEAAYTPDVDNEVYAGMLQRARIATEAGYPVILDAVHRSVERRGQIEALAHELGCPFIGIWCELSLDEAIKRVRTRRGDASDADDIIVKQQFSKPLGTVTWKHFKTDRPIDDLLGETLQQLKVEALV